MPSLWTLQHLSQPSCRSGMQGDKQISALSFTLSPIVSPTPSFTQVDWRGERVKHNGWRLNTAGNGWELTLTAPLSDHDRTDSDSKGRHQHKMAELVSLSEETASQVLNEKVESRSLVSLHWTRYLTLLHPCYPLIMVSDIHKSLKVVKGASWKPVLTTRGNIAFQNMSHSLKYVFQHEHHWHWWIFSLYVPTNQ